jgi:hypothetical protein
MPSSLHSLYGRIFIFLGLLFLLYGILARAGDLADMLGHLALVRLLLVLIAAVCVLGGLLISALGRIEAILLAKRTPNGPVEAPSQP